VAVRTGGPHVRFHWFYVSDRPADAGVNRADKESRIEEDLIRAEMSGALTGPDKALEPPNWLHNGGFEVGLPLNQWSTSYGSSHTIGPGVLDDVQPAEGERCLRMRLFNILQAPDAPSRLNMISRVIKLRPNKTYGFRGQFRSDAPVTVNLVAGTAYGPVTRLGGGRLQAGAAWQTLDVPVKTGDDARGVQLHLTADAPQAATLWMDGFTLAEGRPGRFEASAPVEVGVEWSVPGKVFHAGEPATFVLAARRYAGDGVARVVVRRRVVDYFDRVVADDMLPALDVPPGQTVRHPLDAATGRTGAFRLLLDGTATTADGETRLLLQEYAFCVVPKPPDRMEGTLGAYITLASDPITAMSRAGIRRTVTLSCGNALLEEWRTIEPELGRFVWWDAAVALAKRHDVKILANIHHDHPKWAMDPKDPADALHSRTGNFSRSAWVAFFEKLTAHYRNDIRDWLIIDEPYSTYTVEQYAELMKATYPAAKRGAPDCRVLAHGGFSQEWIDGLVRHDAVKCFDGVSDYARNEAQGLRLRKFRDQTGKFIVNVEYGVHMSLYRTIEAPDNPRDRSSPTCYTLNTESVVAEALRAMCWSGAVGFNRYDARFPGGDFTKLDRHKCMFEYDGALKPPAVAYAIAAQLLDGFRGVEHLALHRDLEALRFERDSRFALVLIARDGQALETALALPVGVETRDIMGNALPGAPEAVILSSAVTYVCGPKAHLDATKAVIAALKPVPVARIETSTRVEEESGQVMLVVSITNQGRRPLDGLADIHPKTGVLRHFWAGPQAVNGLAPGKTAVVSFGLNAYDAEKRRPRACKALFTFGGVTVAQGVADAFAATAPK
jgi:hypothetical protein